MEVTVGNVLLGKYRVDEVLGAGGMGKVLRAWNVYLQQPVAIKILLAHVVDDHATVQRFLREAQATVRLRSEHIARVIDVSTLQDGTPLMVMEYLDGSDLNQILRAHGPQAPSLVVDLMLQACEGIAEAHAMGIVHRDIKPSNFFVTRRIDGTQLLKILDFGISKAPFTANNMELTGTQTVVGTPTYMAPEQMKNARTADARSDIWSMGVVMYQLMEGRPPYIGQSYAELVLKVGTEPVPPLHAKCPNGLNETVMRCLEKDPARRVQSVAELAKMIAPFATDPVGGAFSAERVSRIVTQRTSTGAMHMRGEGATPQPAPLTPSSHGSVSQGSGQVTYQTRASRAWIIAGATALVIIAGAGGYIFSEVTREHPGREGEARHTTPVTATGATGADGSGSGVTVTPLAAIDAGVAAVVVDAAPAVVVAPIDAAPVAVPTATKPTPTPVTTVAPPRPVVPIVTVRPPVTPPATVKPPPKRPTSSDDGLFDSRK